MSNENPKCEIEDCIYKKKGKCSVPSSITITNAFGLFIAGCSYTFKKDGNDKFDDSDINFEYS